MGACRAWSGRHPAARQTAASARAAASSSDVPARRGRPSTRRWRSGARARRSGCGPWPREVNEKPLDDDQGASRPLQRALQEGAALPSVGEVHRLPAQRTHRLRVGEYPLLPHKLFAISRPRSPASREAKGRRKRAAGRADSSARYAVTQRPVSEMRPSCGPAFRRKGATLTPLVCSPPTRGPATTAHSRGCFLHFCFRACATALLELFAAEPWTRTTASTVRMLPGGSLGTTTQVVRLRP